MAENNTQADECLSHLTAELDTIAMKDIVGRFVLLTCDGLIMRDKLKAFIERMVKTKTVGDEFPEIKGEITEIRAAGKTGDLKESLDLINLGWPVVVLVADGVKHYGIPKSFRGRVDVDTQKISVLN